MTDFSQPGVTLEEGCAQRAAVCGFCSKSAARSLAAVTLCSDLIVLARPPDEPTEGHYVPITLEDYHPFTWGGRFVDLEESEEWSGLHSDAIAALRSSWRVWVIDPRWGRQRYLWRRIIQALEKGTAPFDAAPSPKLDLGVSDPLH